MAEVHCAITTVDNPYDPFDQFESWFLFDEEKGYHTISLLGRVSRTSDQFSEQENREEIEHAIDEIVKYDFQNLYCKVTKEIEEV